MGYFTPFLAYIGGGSAATGAAYVAVAASTAYSIHAGRQAAGAQEAEMEVAQREESAAARDREVQRKRRIVAVLGAQSAEAAAKGLELSGSVANISIEDAKMAAEDSRTDSVNTANRIDALKRGQREVGRAFNARSVGSILSAGQTIATSIGGRGKPPAETQASTRVIPRGPVN